MSLRVVADALDAELTRRVEAQNHLADALVELERHPGNRLLGSAALTGTTAARWATVRDLLPRLWADLASHRVVVAAACAVRTRRPRPGEREWAELHELLVARTVEASTLTLGELAARMEGRIREVADVLEAAETVHLAALAGLGPLVERVRDAQGRGRELLEPDDPDAAALAALATAVDERLATCTNDPLSLPARLPRDLADGLGDDLDAIEARLADLATVRDGWADRRRAVADAVAALDPLAAREAQARDEALARVAVVLPPASDPRPALHRRLAALPMTRPHPAALAALPDLDADACAAADALRCAVERATGVTDRRAELAGRFAAYRAKALRLGVSDDPAVVALATQVRALLSAPRTDLQALTPALVAYQQRVNGVERRPA
jgi:hypothetical protein